MFSASRNERQWNRCAGVVDDGLEYYVRVVEPSAYETRLEWWHLDRGRSLT